MKAAGLFIDGIPVNDQLFVDTVANDSQFVAETSPVPLVESSEATTTPATTPEVLDLGVLSTLEKIKAVLVDTRAAPVSSCFVGATNIKVAKTGMGDGRFFAGRPHFSADMYPGIHVGKRIHAANGEKSSTPVVEILPMFDGGFWITTQSGASYIAKQKKN